MTLMLKIFVLCAIFLLAFAAIEVDTDDDDWWMA